MQQQQQQSQQPPFQAQPVMMQYAIWQPREMTGEDPMYAAVVTSGKRPYFPPMLDHNHLECRVHCYYIHTATGVHRISIKRVKLAGVSEKTIALNGLIIASCPAKMLWRSEVPPHILNLVVRTEICNGSANFTFTLEQHEIEIYYGHPNACLATPIQLVTPYKPASIIISVDGQPINGGRKPNWSPWLDCVLTTLAFPFIMIASFLFTILLPFICIIYCVAQPGIKFEHYDACNRQRIPAPPIPPPGSAIPGYIPQPPPPNVPMALYMPPQGALPPPPPGSMPYYPQQQPQQPAGMMYSAPPPPPLPQAVAAPATIDTMPLLAQMDDEPTKHPYMPPTL